MITTNKIQLKTKTRLKTAKVKSKSYQLRLTITPQIQADLLDARKDYPYLDDVEIIKVWIGKGRQKDAGLNLSDPTNEEMLLHASKSFQLGEDWENQPDNIDYSKAKPIN